MNVASWEICSSVIVHPARCSTPGMNLPTRPQFKVLTMSLKAGVFVLLDDRPRPAFGGLQVEPVELQRLRQPVRRLATFALIAVARATVLREQVCARSPSAPAACPRLAGAGRIPERVRRGRDDPRQTRGRTMMLICLLVFSPALLLRLAR